MAQVAANPFVMQDVILVIDSDNYEATVSAVTVTPQAQTSTWKGLTPASVFNFAGRSTWTAQIDGAQDLENSKSLSRYTLEHEGESKEIEFRPRGAAQSGIAVTAIITPGQIGGAVDGVATATFTFPVQGRPEFV